MLWRGVADLVWGPVSNAQEANHTLSTPTTEHGPANMHSARVYYHPGAQHCTVVLDGVSHAVNDLEINGDKVDLSMGVKPGQPSDRALVPAVQPPAVQPPAHTAPTAPTTSAEETPPPAVVEDVPGE